MLFLPFIGAVALLALPALIEGSKLGANDPFNTNENHEVATSVEELHLSHSLRHQEHYEQRIQKAVDDFKKERDKNFIESATATSATATATMATASASATVIRTTANDNNNKNLRLQQLRAAQNGEQKPQQQQHQHHLRHEQHLQHQRKQLDDNANNIQHQQQHHIQQQQQEHHQQQQQQQQHHHLRHHNHHHLAWEQRVLPIMRHQQHRFGYAARASSLSSPSASAKMPFAPPAISTTPNSLLPTITVSTTDGPMLGVSWNHTKARRYFDRDSVYNWAQTTRGPKRFSTTSNNRFNLAFGDDNRPFGDNDFDEYSAEQSVRRGAEKDTRTLNENRFTLHLENSAEQLEEQNEEDYVDDINVNANVMKNAKHNRNEESISNDNIRNNGNEDVNDDDNGDDDEDDNDDDDYSYEDSRETKKIQNQNEFPSISSPMGKVSVKRNLFTNLFKSFQTKSIGKDQQQEQKQQHSMKTNPKTPTMPPSAMATATAAKLEQTTASSHDKSNSKTKKLFIDETDENYGDNNDDDDDDDNDENGDDDDNNNDNNNNNGFSNEKWNKIEHEHHLKQQQRQKELQALRMHKGQHQTKIIEDNENIYSRYYTQGSVSGQKLNELGTPEAVTRTHQVHISRNNKDKALAERHFRQMLQQTSCRIPQPRVEHIQRDPSKIYSPSCTLLHRCADDTGCCGSSLTCAPKHSNKVHLYFTVHRRGKTNIIERMTFVNHTECHCIARTKISENVARISNNNFYYDGIYDGSNSLQTASVLNCNCPNLFEKILQDDGICRCDCSSSNTGCDWFKRGMEHFSMRDRKCIHEGRCKPPTCENGNYNKKFGRCPRQGEQQHNNS